jgi:pyruvate/2-oxoglutarate dehydrogenase complex dihydrolipoamide dehydrogenase (E3) component
VRRGHNARVGLIRMVADADAGELLGVAMMGANAGAVIS